MSRPKLSIRNKILFAICALIVSFSLFSWIYTPSQVHKILDKRFSYEVKILADAAALGVSLGLSTNDLTATQKTFEFVKSFPEVSFIVLEVEGEVLATYPDDFEYEPDAAELANMFVRSSPLDSNTVSGQVILGCSRETIDSAVFNSRISTLVISLVVLVVGLSFAVWLSGGISKPITRLKQATLRVGHGEMPEKIEIKTGDEIEDLAQAFNLMVENIQNTNKNLKKEKASVERKVHLATKQAKEEKEYLAESVERILAEMEKFADGDLTVCLPPGKDDEIGKLSVGFNRAIQNINGMLSRFTENILQTVSASKNISASTEGMARGAQEQTGRSFDIAAAIEQMAQTIVENTRNTTLAAGTAEKAGKNAREGRDVVHEAIAGIDKIKSVVMSSSQTVEELGHSSDQIGEIVQVIDEIADQTDLLALNAAIEAARAGDQGRGFAVVADEVRKLAERTTRATREIAEKITIIQRDAVGTVDSMRQISTEVEHGKQLVDTAGSSLERILKDTNETIDVISRVATASDEQSKASEEISHNMDEISREVKSFESGIQEIAQIAEALLEMTSTLQGALNTFKLRQQGEAEDSGFPEYEDEIHEYIEAG